VSTLRLAKNARATSTITVAQAGAKATIHANPGQNALPRVFTAADVQDPLRLAQLLTAIARDQAASTRAARTNPMNGGVIIRNVTLSTNFSAPSIVLHNMGRPYQGYMVARCYGATLPVTLSEVALPNGLSPSMAVALVSTSLVPHDLWVF
jgi:hypothetical protein